MSTKVGKVVSVNFDVDIEKKDGSGSYKGWQLIYSLPNGKIESVQKHMNSLKFTPGLRSSLEALAPQDDFTIHFEKKGEFQEVAKVTKGADDTAVVSAPAPVKVAGSNYETKEERALRQRLIVRQSSLSAAIELRNDDSVDEILALADRFTDWVFENNKQVEVE